VVARSARLARWRVLTLAGALALPGACGDSVSPGTRAVLIGIDGADWKLVEALAADGRMPHLSALLERGSWGPIETLADIPLSPVIWTSVATGKTAAKHGISWFLVDRPDGTRAPVRSHNRKAKAIWNLLAERDRRALVVGWWATYPAEDIGEGLIVSDALGFHGFGATARGGDDRRKTHPGSLFEWANARVPAEQQISAEFAMRFLHVTPEEYRERRFDPARHPRRNPSDPIQLFQQYAVTAQGYSAIAEDLLANEPYDLFLVYYEQVDSFSHLFMKYAPPKLAWIAEVEFAHYRDVVAAWYAYQDELLGRLLVHVDLETTAVFVLSDHGFKSGERRIRSEKTVDIRKAHLDHEHEGIFVAAGPHIRRGVQLDDASVMDVTPTLLTYLGLPVGKDMDGKVLTPLFDEAFLAAYPIRYVASYEEPQAQERAPRIAEGVEEEELAETFAALDALGYVEGGSEGAAQDPGTPDADASSPEIHNNLGRVHLRGGDVENAWAEFLRALALDEHNAEALLNLGTIARLRGNGAAAEHYVKRALQVDPNSIAALAQLAELRRDDGDLAESIRLYREALAIDDSQPFVHLGLGDSLQRSGRYPEAAETFQSVLALDPDSFEAHYNLGVTYFHQRRLAEAADAYEKALALRPEHPQAASALNNLGSIHIEQGELDEGIARFEQAVKASPRHFESRYNLAVQYLRVGRLDEGIPLLEQGVALAPNHEALNTTLAQAYLREGRNEDAFRGFLLVRRLYPGNWVAPLGLAALHAASERPEQARALLGEALALGGDAGGVGLALAFTVAGPQRSLSRRPRAAVAAAWVLRALVPTVTWGVTEASAGIRARSPGTSRLHTSRALLPGMCRRAGRSASPSGRRSRRSCPAGTQPLKQSQSM
jgi:tetratricopeptide (TPR) repeat protein/predicted AlkP superfamily pyrophosphatase or phosphodiesterase